MIYKAVTIGVAAFSLGVVLSSIPVFAQQQVPGYTSQGTVTGVPNPPARQGQQPSAAVGGQPGGPMSGYTPQGTVRGLPLNAAPQGKQLPTTIGGQPAGPSGPGGVPISPGGAQSHGTDVGGPGAMGPSYNSSGKRQQ